MKAVQASDSMVCFFQQISHNTSISDGVLGSPAPPHNVTYTATSQLLTGLTPNTLYSVSVSARTSAGSSIEISDTNTTSLDGKKLYLGAMLIHISNS